jgi:hypothetical protein
VEYNDISNPHIIIVKYLRQATFNERLILAHDSGGLIQDQAALLDWASGEGSTPGQEHMSE